MTTTKGNTNMTTKKKRTRRTHCTFCGRQLTEKPVGEATDRDLCIAAYQYGDDYLVWIDREGRAMCDASHNSIEHMTPADHRNAYQR